MTYQNLGYWIGQSNDTSTGSHPTGWTNGQRWSETASEWNAMYGSMTTDRDYWKTTVAHDDPNVYTNRYNAGYSAADVAESPRAYDYAQLNLSADWNVSGVLGRLPLNSAVQNGATVTCDTGNNRITVTRSGQYVIEWVGLTEAYQGATALDKRVRINGTDWSSGNYNPSQADGWATHAVTGNTILGAGSYVDVYVQTNSGTGTRLKAGGQTFLRLIFVPTPTYSQ